MGAYEVANGLESAAVARLKAIYESALRTALRRQHAFLAQIKAIDEGKIKPPQWYVDRGKEKEWREGFTRELLRKNKVIEGIMEDLNAVGGDAADIIREFTCDVYDVTRKETIEILSHEAAQMGVNPSFATYNKRQIGVLIRDAQSPFSKLAYANLGKNPAVRRRLQNEMAQAAILGESQQKLVKRIQAVTGQLTWQAKRVAQTERTHVQSQARFEAGAEAQALGVKVFHEWSTRMINSRDTHIALNGKKAMQGEKFPGSMLRFPGDPNAPASEVINCHCVLIPGVLLPGEKLKDTDDDFFVFRSVGAKAKNYEIVDKSSGKIYHFVEGQRIQDAKTFAGFGGVKPLEEATIEGLCREFGGTPEKWSHRKGVAYIEFDGEEVKAEIHWFQEETVGKVKFKVKKFLDED